ncbi:MAG: penicillin-binding protein activator [Legionella sp.]|nr:MAG: penicillin-binding protein activator [Legionella sp.]
MLINLYKNRLFFFLVSAFLLCQCTKAVNSPISISMVESEQKIESPYSLPTASYLAMAKKQDGEEKQSSLIKAAGRFIDEGQWRQGTAILAQTRDLNEDQQNEKTLLLAKVDLIRDQAKAALVKLGQIKEPDNLPLYNQIQRHELLAQAHRVQNNFAESIAARIQLGQLAKDAASQTANYRTLWLTLNSLSQADLDTMAAEASRKSELQGWLQLAMISRKYRDNPKSLLAALDQWQTHFVNHPANRILPEPLDSIADKLISSPKQVALLLPLSGALSGPGKAIQDGFMAAYKANNGKASTKVKVYDTDKGEVTALYQQAISEGANYVVGPLTKAQVAKVAAIEHPVPTLFLNDSEVALQDNSYLFGLSPAHEATQVASKARSKGYQRALIIAPKNDWGAEVTKAFTKQWQESGGRVVDTFAYSNTDDMNKKMQDFLHISQSQTREKKLKHLLGDNIEASTSRRQDFDMIFLLAYPSKARQIMPMLKYYYAGDVPVYATSSVYAGSANALKDKDLEGLIFCDIPWVFSHQVGTRNWPEQFNSYNRLYALGMDSYALATQLNQLMLFPTDGSKDTNGILYLKPTKQVARELEWGQFRQGLAHSLG